MNDHAPASRPPWFFRFLGFVIFYVKEVVLSNFAVAWDVLTPRDRMRPAFIGLDVANLSNRQRFILANLVTMTPGTLTMDFNPDEGRLYVHAMYAEDPDAFRAFLEDKFVAKICSVF